MSKQYDFNQAPALTAYVADVSYFSGKLEAFLRYKEIPYQRRIVNVGVLVNEIYANTGMMKMPAVQLSDGLWLKDTTPMLAWFDKQKPEHSIYPEDPVTSFIALLLEDYADEWCWRSALYWRWRFPETRNLLGKRVGKEILGDWPLPPSVAAWYVARRQTKTYLTGDGLTKETEPFIKNHYTDMLESLQAILADSPYLLGDKPSVADYGLFGPMFRHFGLDPAPAQVMIEKAPAVYEWLARLWNQKSSGLSCDLSFNDFSHPGFRYFLKEIIDVYLPFLKANAGAWLRAEDRFDLVTPSVTYRKLKTVHYRVYCLESLQNQFNALSNEDVTRLLDVFSEFGVFDLGPPVASGMAEEFNLPLKPISTTPNSLEKLILSVTGTPWDTPRWKK